MKILVELKHKNDFERRKSIDFIFLLWFRVQMTIISLMIFVMCSSKDNEKISIFYTMLWFHYKRFTNIYLAEKSPPKNSIATRM